MFLIGVSRVRNVALQWSENGSEGPHAPRAAFVIQCGACEETLLGAGNRVALYFLITLQRRNLTSAGTSDCIRGCTTHTARHSQRHSLKSKI